MVNRIINNINDLILNPIIILLFSVAFLVFLWGIVQFIRSETADAKRAEGQRRIGYGLLGMFIMFSVYGIINFLLNTFGIPAPGYPF